LLKHLPLCTPAQQATALKAQVARYSNNRTATNGASLQAGSVRYFHTIVHHFHLGSITAISDETGAVVERMSYDPWGKRRFTI
jgi:hypothetical protein